MHFWHFLPKCTTSWDSIHSNSRIWAKAGWFDLLTISFLDNRLNLMMITYSMPSYFVTKWIPIYWFFSSHRQWKLIDKSLFTFWRLPLDSYFYFFLRKKFFQTSRRYDKNPSPMNLNQKVEKTVMRAYLVVKYRWCVLVA